MKAFLRQKPESKIFSYTGTAFACRSVSKDEVLEVTKKKTSEGVE